jgi:DNA-binding HxlR family transcriptional regulator
VADPGRTPRERADRGGGGSGSSRGSRGSRERTKPVPPPEVDRLIHERLRLGILSALVVNESLTFRELKTLMRATDGNLSVHARKLEHAKYIACTKTFVGRLPKTEFRITELGRRALLRYVDHMEALIAAMRDRK